MMRESFRSFSASWRNIRSLLPDGEIDYVGLGPGNGSNDRMVLSRLMNESGRHPFYVAVDMSAEMLHLAAQAVMQGTNLQGDMLVGVQLDSPSWRACSTWRSCSATSAGTGPSLLDRAAALNDRLLAPVGRPDAPDR